MGSFCRPSIEPIKPLFGNKRPAVVAYFIYLSSSLVIIYEKFEANCVFETASVRDAVHDYKSFRPSNVCFQRCCESVVLLLSMEKSLSYYFIYADSSQLPTVPTSPIFQSLQFPCQLSCCMCKRVRWSRIHRCNGV